jgi:hypothetical protein
MMCKQDHLDNAEGDMDPESGHCGHANIDGGGVC